MSQPVNGNSFDAWIAENNFVMALGSGIAFKSGLHIMFKHHADFGEFFKKIQRALLRYCFEIMFIDFWGCLTFLFMA